MALTPKQLDFIVAKVHGLFQEKIIAKITLEKIISSVIGIFEIQIKTDPNFAALNRLFTEPQKFKELNLSPNDIIEARKTIIRAADEILKPLIEKIEKAELSKWQREWNAEALIKDLEINTSAESKDIQSVQVVEEIGLKLLLNSANIPKATNVKQQKLTSTHHTFDEGYSSSDSSGDGTIHCSDKYKQTKPCLNLSDINRELNSLLNLTKNTLSTNIEEQRISSV
jgi:hypothetical protein